MLARKPFLACVLALGLLPGTSLADAAPSLDPRVEAAALLYREQGAEKALPVFEKLAGEFTRGSRTRATPSQALALHYLGECHWRLGNFDTARRYLERALALERSAGDRPGEGRTLNVRGLLSWDQGQYDAAIADFRKAGEIARAAGDRRLEGSSLNNLSLVYDEQGDYDLSLRQYEHVLELYRGTDFARGIGDTLGNIGGVHLLLGHYREALDHYRQALAISERLGSATSMSQDHGNIALCLLGLGEGDAALAHLEQAIGFARQAGLRQDQAYWLRARGDALVDTGRYDLGLQDYRTALGIYEALGAPAELLEALHASGELHLLLGDVPSAARDFERALQLARSIGLDRGITLNLASLGDLELRRGRLDAAAALYEQARRRASSSRMQPALAASLLRLARVHRSQSRLGDAASETSQALAIARTIGAPGLEAEALYGRAEAARLASRPGPALEDYDAARVASTPGDPDLLWQIHFGRARVQESVGDVAAAIRSLETAIEVIESVRARLAEPRFRSGYLDDKFEVYLLLMHLQLHRGQTAEAFSTAERLRARSFVEQLGGRAAVPLTASERRDETALRERVRRLQQSIVETDDSGAPAYPARAVTRFSVELAVAETNYQTFLDDHARVDAAAAKVPSVTSLQRRLGHDQALVEYVVGRDSLAIFVVTSRGLSVALEPVRETDLSARVSLLRDLVRRPGEQRWQKVANRLAAELVAPIERTGWLDGMHHLYVVPHGVLSYLPFALLPRSGTEPASLLVDRYTVAYLPAAATLLRRAPRGDAPPSVLAVAPSRSRLQHAPEEARAVDAVFRPNARTLLGGEATEARFKQLAPGFRVLHLATHGYFNPLNPLLSGLELEPDAQDDGMLRVHEIVDLRLRADLVTLSACDTALGSGFFSDRPAGDDFVGLNRAFLAAGSRAVVAALWEVDDRASVSLMTRFYSRLAEPAGAAGALAHAQRALRRSPALAHPYYWAAYVVVGPIDSGVDLASGLRGQER